MYLYFLFQVANNGENCAAYVINSLVDSLILSDTFRVKNYDILEASNIVSSLLDEVIQKVTKHLFISDGVKFLSKDILEYTTIYRENQENKNYPGISFSGFSGKARRIEILVEK